MHPSDDQNPRSSSSSSSSVRASGGGPAASISSVIRTSNMNKDKVSPPLPAVSVDDDDVIKQIKAQRQPLLAVMPANNNNKTTTVADDPWIVLAVVCLWALFNSVLFTALDIARVILNLTPCTKSTWLFRCVSLTGAAAAEVWFLLSGELLCSTAAAAALAAPLHMLLTRSRSRRTTTTMSHWWAAAAVHAQLAWVTLAATVGMHCMKVASDRIILAADPARNTVHIAFGCVCLALDLLAAVLLCCSPPRRRLEQLGEHRQGSNY